MTTRLSVNINDEIAATLRSLGEEQSTTVTEQVRKAVSVYAFFREREAKGMRIHLVSPDGSVTEVIRL